MWKNLASVMEGEIVRLEPLARRHEVLVAVSERERVAVDGGRGERRRRRAPERDVAGERSRDRERPRPRGVERPGPHTALLPAAVAKYRLHLYAIIHHHKRAAFGNGRFLRVQFNFYALHFFAVYVVIYFVCAAVVSVHGSVFKI